MSAPTRPEAVAVSVGLFAPYDLVAFAAVTRIVTTKSLFGGTIVSANRSHVGSMPSTRKQLSGFGASHVRPAHVIVGESAEIAATAGLAADSKGGAIGFVTISVMAVTVAIMIRFTSIHSFRAMRASGTNGAIVSPLSLSGSAADGAVLSKQFLWKVTAVTGVLTVALF